MDGNACSIIPGPPCVEHTIQVASYYRHAQMTAQSKRQNTKFSEGLNVF